MNGFTLQQPWMLLMLALVPLLELLLRRARRIRDEAIRSYGSTHSVEMSQHQQQRQRVEWCTLAGLTLLVLALSRPGVNPTPRLNPAGGRDVIFVLDVSRSMLADDVRPSRLARAKEDISRCLNSMPNDRVGLILFAGSAAIRCPLTTEHGFLRQMLRDASPDSVPLGSTYLQSALEKTTEKMIAKDRQDLADVILLTDGGDQGSHPEETLAGLNHVGARLLVIGYGDPKIGARIPIEGENGTDFVIHEGREVWSKLEEPSLQLLTDASSAGQYFRGGTPGFDLGKSYQQWSSNAPRRFMNERGSMKYDELFAWLLVPALALLLHPFPGFSKKSGPLLLVFCLTMNLHSADAVSELEQLREAAAAETNPVRRTELTFHLGVTLMKNASLEDAVAAFQSAAEATSSPESLAVCRYNEALALAALAEQAKAPSGALAALDAGIAAMRDTRLLRPDWQAAAQGLEVLYARHASAREALKLQQEQLDELNKQAKELQEELKRLLEEQRKLLAAGTIIQRDRQTPVAEKSTALLEIRSQQVVVANNTQNARAKMASLASAMASLTAMVRDAESPSPAEPETPTDFDEPLKHLTQARTAQDAAISQLGPLEQLNPALKGKKTAVDELEAALNSMSSGQSDEGESSDESEESETGEEGEESDSESTDSQSMQMSGDLMSDPANRALPKPNFSPEDILQEEQENAESRTKNKPSRVGKGEKDW